MNIYFKSCTSNFNYWNNSRPIVSSKSELTLVCLYSVLRSMRRELDTLTIVDNSSFPGDIQKMKKIIGYFDIRYKIESTHLDSNDTKTYTMADTHRKTYDLITNSNDDIYYFIEDDYLHKSFAISAIENFILKYPDYIVYSIENSDLYDTPYIVPPREKSVFSSNILITEHCHWRSVKTSTLTLAMKKSIFTKHSNEFFYSCESMDNVLHHKHNIIYDTTPCYSPMPSLTGHISEMCLPLFGEWDKKYKKRLKELTKIITV